MSVTTSVPVDHRRDEPPEHLTRADRVGLLRHMLLMRAVEERSMFEAMRIARRRAVAGEGPTLIEALTMRMHGHAAHDDQRYVPADQLAAWRERDPIDRQAARVAALGVDVDTLRAEVTAQVDEAAREALASPMPDPADATDGVFATEEVAMGDGAAPWSGWSR